MSKHPDDDLHHLIWLCRKWGHPAMWADAFGAFADRLQHRPEIEALELQQVKLTADLEARRRDLLDKRACREAVERNTAVARARWSETERRLMLLPPRPDPKTLEGALFNEVLRDRQEIDREIYRIGRGAQQAREEEMRAAQKCFETEDALKSNALRLVRLQTAHDFQCKRAAEMLAEIETCRSLLKSLYPDLSQDVPALGQPARSDPAALRSSAARMRDIAAWVVGREFRELTDSTGPPARAKTGTGRGKDIDGRMRAVIQRTPDARMWSVREWKKHLGEGSLSTIQGTPTWRACELARLTAKEAGRKKLSAGRESRTRSE